jgi:hypothetical protein
MGGHPGGLHPTVEAANVFLEVRMTFCPSN